MDAVLKTSNKSFLGQYKEDRAHWLHSCYDKVISIGSCSAHMIIRMDRTKTESGNGGSKLILFSHCYLVTFQK